MKLNLKQYGAVTIMTIATSFSSADQSSLDELVKSFKTTDKLCVGYRASKKVPFLGPTDVTGINCSDIMFDRNSQNEVQISFKPQFNSGNGIRDSHVLDLLGGDKNAPVIITISLDGLNAPPESKATLKGRISILDKQTPITLDVFRLSSTRIGVQVQTRFSDLNLDRPQIGPFGIGGSVNEELVLFGQINTSDASALLQEKK